jgi:hypothetical protein
MLERMLARRSMGVTSFDIRLDYLAPVILSAESL